jgi:hypothetical protein
MEPMAYVQETSIQQILRNSSIAWKALKDPPEYARDVRVALSIQSIDCWCRWFVRTKIEHIEKRTMNLILNAWDKTLTY